jgi:hypothetical protein
MKTRPPSMRLAARLGLAAAAVAALGLSACHRPRPHPGGERGWNGRAASVADPLVCPPTVGGLTRTAQAGDGQSCGYRGPGDERVDLQRLALAGQAPQAALAPLEARLRALVPPHGGPKAPDVDAADGRDDAKVDLPGIHVNTQGDKAEVKVFGVTVNADGDKADVRVGHGDSRTVVLAGPDGAEIRVDDVDRANARLVFILADDKPAASGLRAVGYLARGPAAGPLAVATFKSGARREDWRGDRDLNGLLDLNVKQ